MLSATMPPSAPARKGQQWPLAMPLFGGMKEAKVDPDVISYNAAISSCEKGQQWPVAMHLFGSMPKAKVDADVIYNAAISSCEKGPAVALAMHVFGSMPKPKLTKMSSATMPPSAPPRRASSGSCNAFVWQHAQSQS